MKKEEKFLNENQVLINQFREQFKAYTDSIADKEADQKEQAILDYWKAAIAVCEEGGQKTNWKGLVQFYQILEIPTQYQITQKQYEQIINQ